MPRDYKHLKKFQKGQSGNPAGRPPDVLGRKMRALTAEEFREMANLIVKGDMNELKEIAKDPNQTALRAMIASVAIKITERGDMHSLDIFLNRLVGKVKEHIEVTGANKGPQVIFHTFLNGSEAPDEEIKDVSDTKAD